jgi:hypothetical protein
MWKYDIAFKSMRGVRGKMRKNKKKLCKDTLRCMDARFIKRTRTKNFMHVKFYHSNKEKFAAKNFQNTMSSFSLRAFTA